MGPGLTGLAVGFLWNTGFRLAVEAIHAIGVFSTSIEAFHPRTGANKRGAIDGSRVVAGSCTIAMVGGIENVVDAVGWGAQGSRLPLSASSGPITNSIQIAGTLRISSALRLNIHSRVLVDATGVAVTNGAQPAVRFRISVLGVGRASSHGTHEGAAFAMGIAGRITAIAIDTVLVFAFSVG